MYLLENARLQLLASQADNRKTLHVFHEPYERLLGRLWCCDQSCDNWTTTELTLPEKLGGVCGPLPKTLTLFITKMTKIGQNRYPIYDQNG